jgi:hypothetical protein
MSLASRLGAAHTPLHRHHRRRHHHLRSVSISQPLLNASVLLRTVYECGRQAQEIIRQWPAPSVLRLLWLLLLGARWANGHANRRLWLRHEDLRRTGLRHQHICEPKHFEVSHIHGIDYDTYTAAPGQPSDSRDSRPAAQTGRLAAAPASWSHSDPCCIFYAMQTDVTQAPNRQSPSVLHSHIAGRIAGRSRW